MAQMTNINWYITAIFAVVLVFVGYLVLGNSLASNTDISLDNKSYVYINSYSALLSNAGMTSFNSSTEDLKKQNLLTDEEDDGEPSITDVIAQIKYFINRISKIVPIILLIYNIPTLFISALGIPLLEVNHFINIIGWMFFTYLTIVFVRLVRGS